MLQKDCLTSKAIRPVRKSGSYVTLTIVSWLCSDCVVVRGKELSFEEGNLVGEVDEETNSMKSEGSFFKMGPKKR